MASWYEQFDRVFEEMDTDKSGYLDEAEVQKALLVSGYSLSAEEAKVWYMYISTAKSMMVKFIKIYNENLCIWFDNYYYHLCSKEYAIIFLQILFDDMDTSGDGQVSKEEFRQAMVDALEPTAHE